LAVPLALVLAGTACSAGDDDADADAQSPTTTAASADTVVAPTTEPSETTPAASTAPADPGFVPAPLVWEDFGDGVDATTLEVPVDYDDPDGDTFELFVARHPATGDRIGSLLINPGGPGFGGADYALFAEQVFDEELIEHFDIVAWDPRGTGLSEPAIDCVDDFDPYFAGIDITPDSAEEREQAVAVAAEFAGECVRNNESIVRHVGTNASARDIDTLRRALGEDTISYFGFSYGSELGGAWATLFPDTVRAAVFDGARDPDADSTEFTAQQQAGFEAALATFLARCSSDDECAFHNGGDAEGAFDALMAELDENPVPADPDRPAVDRGTATFAVQQAMYDESYWPALEQALAAAEDGDGTGLLALRDSYFQRRPDGTYGNELEAFQTISCADQDERFTVEEEDARVPRFTEVAPRLNPEGAIGSYFCTFFPESIDPRVAITGAGAGPIVVIGTTGDPATPLSSTRAMAEALEDGRLVIVEADQHTGYNVNRCINDLVNRYLIDLEPPESGTECR
jgi:pimeloyl-ACP methyl ester carboxylesterase